MCTGAEDSTSCTCWDTTGNNHTGENKLLDKHSWLRADCVQFCFKKIDWVEGLDV
jgi:hypothetical protein